MSISILECKEDLITFSKFIKKNDVISIGEQDERVLECSSSEWIYDAAIAIKELIKRSKVIFPVVILLPEFALLTKSIKVPHVNAAKASYVIHAHIAQILGISEKECLGFVVRSSNEMEMEVICSLVKKDWIESFCKAIELIGVKIESMQSPVIHYYNAFNLHFPFNSRNVLLIVIHGLSVSCVFFGYEDVVTVKLQMNNNDFNSSIKELLEFYKTKSPGNMPKEVLVSGLSHNSKDLIDSLSNYICLPVKLFAPLSGETSLLGSIGFVYAKWVGKGLFIDLMPSAIGKGWALRRNKKVFLFAGICILATCSYLLITLIYQGNRYDNLIRAYQGRIVPLREVVSIIDHNEKAIKLYEEGLKTLQLEMQSSHSWINFLNALQSILAKIPGIQIHSLAIVNAERVFEDSWSNAMLGTEKVQKLSIEPRLLDLSGVVQIENSNEASNKVIDDLRYLIAQLTKLDFIEDTKTIYFDMGSFPAIPFSVSLILKPQTF